VGGENRIRLYPKNNDLACRQKKQTLWQEFDWMSVARLLNDSLSFITVRNLWNRYQQRGKSGSGSAGSRFTEASLGNAS
jgi:hypothetical protein